MAIKFPLLPKSIRWFGVGAVAITILYFSLITIPPETPGTQGPFWDKKLHFAAYGGLTMATAYASAGTAMQFKRRLSLVVGGVFLYGIAIEMGQGLTPTRYVSMLDLVANGLGILLGSIWFAIEGILEYR